MSGEEQTDKWFSLGIYSKVNYNRVRFSDFISLQITVTLQFIFLLLYWMTNKPPI